MNRKLLVVYASRYGQTEKIARRIAEIAQQAGIAAGAAALAEAPPLDDVSDVIVAGSVYFGRHARALLRFIRRNLPALAAKHTAFVSVCGDADEPGADLARAQSYVDNSLRATVWTPNATAVFAGATPYTRYGWLVRHIVRRIAKDRGLGTDTTRDYEYTDWGAVEAFARMFVNEARARVA